MRENITNLLLDFDGTVADTFSYYFNNIDLMYPKLGLKNMTAQEIGELKGMDYKSILRFANISFLSALIMGIRIKYKLNNETGAIRSFPEMNSFITDLHLRGIKISIVTINSKENIEKFFAKEGLSNCFSNIWTTGLRNSKTHLLKKLIVHKQIDPEHTLFIGDEVRDVAACKQAGIRCAAVTWGFNSKKALVDASPDYIIENVTQLKDLLQT